MSRKWHRAAFDALGRRDKDGKVHYHDLIKIFSSAGLRHSDLIKSALKDEIVPIKSRCFSNIKNKKMSEAPKSRTLSTTIDKIKKFWTSEAISRISPNKTHVTKRKKAGSPTECIPIHFRKYTIKESFDLFLKENPGIKCGRTTFFNNKPPSVKKAKSKQDCCPICKESKKFLPILESQHSSKLNSSDLEALEAFKFHKVAASTQSKHYEDSLSSLKEGKALLVMDFKANISLGKGPEQDSGVFFNAPQRTIFGVVGFFKKNGELFKIIFTIVSSVLNHDSRTVCEILNGNIFPHSIFRHFKVTEIDLWMDNAPSQFRNKEHFSTIYNLSLKYKMKLNMNFFAEYHGKSECDRHFGLISRIYTDRCSYGDKEVCTTLDFLDLYCSAIRKFGGRVIPTIGSVIEGEILPESGTGLNVIASEFSYPETRSFLEKYADLSKKVPRFDLPYERSKMKVLKQIKVVRGEKPLNFILHHYYCFTFEGSTITARLSKKNPPLSFKFIIETEYKHDYSVKLGAPTSSGPKYSSLNRVVSRNRFHSSQSQ
jgi:hypothetical protein